MSERSEQTQPEYDPVFVHSRREAMIICCVWVAALMWTVPYCYFTGYVGPVDAENFKTVLGMPAWLFWGVFVPWGVANLFTIWFCFFYMKDEDLGQVDGSTGAAERPEGDA